MKNIASLFLMSALLCIFNFDLNASLLAKRLPHSKTILAQRSLAFKAFIRKSTTEAAHTKSTADSGLIFKTTASQVLGGPLLGYGTGVFLASMAYTATFGDTGVAKACFFMGTAIGAGPACFAGPIGLASHLATGVALTTAAKKNPTFRAFIERMNR